jgi:ankyrin repeat protein
MVQHSSKRHIILLNDVLLITSIQSSGFMSGDKLDLHQVLDLEQMSVIDLVRQNPQEDPAAFEIRTPDRPYQFLAESVDDKSMWLEELDTAICAIMSSKPTKPLGWYHEVFLGTIYSAAMYQELDCLRSHLERMKGQPPNLPDDSGMTALHWAAMNGKVDAVKLLIDSGADVDALNAGLNTPVLLAAAFGHEDTIFCLMDYGADISIKNLKDLNVLYMAVLYGSHSPGLKSIIAALKLRGIDLNRADASGATALHACASRNLGRPVQILVDCGADVNQKHTRTGLTPLHIACSSALPDAETVRAFLDKGAQPNWKDSGGRTAFDMVMKSQQVLYV